jgi:hypothetical protein
MSATTEMIAEQLSQLKERMASARRRGEPTDDLERQHVDLLTRLNAASAALNEGKQLLKG